MMSLAQGGSSVAEQAGGKFTPRSSGEADRHCHRKLGRLELQRGLLKGCSPTVCNINMIRSTHSFQTQLNSTFYPISNVGFTATALDLSVRSVPPGPSNHFSRPQISKYIPHSFQESLLSIPAAVAIKLGFLVLNSIAMTDVTYDR